MYFKVSSEITWVTKCFAAEIALVWLHAYVPHEVDMKLRRRDKSLRTHGAFPLPLLAVAWSWAAGMSLTGEVAGDVTG